MTIWFYQGGPLPRQTRMVAARQGVVTLKGLFGLCLPELTLPCEIRGLAPFPSPVPAGQGLGGALAPSHHLLTQEAPLPVCNPRRLYQYFLAGNGVFLVARSRDVEVCLPLAVGPIPGLVHCNPSVQFLHPRVPIALVEEMLASAWRAYVQGPEERLFYLLCERGHWSLVEPEQEATEESVRACAPTAASWNAVLEGHSHHRFAAFFSSGDDEAELLDGGCRLFFVVGGFGRQREILVRLCIHGYAWLLPADLFLELPSDVQDASWHGGRR